MTSDQLRVAVIGAGLIGQAVHIPTLLSLSDRFAVVGVADPSHKVRAGLESRYPGVNFHEDWHTLLDREELDAIVVCSPHATHAEIALTALDRGLHVFVEKPLAIRLQDIDEIERRAFNRELVVQVGYMKRFDAGYEALLTALPAAEEIRFVDVVTYDPWMARPPFAPSDLIAGDDIAEALRTELSILEREQVQAEVGTEDPASVKAFSQVYLQALIHDVNLVHGVLEHLGIRCPLPAITSAHWAHSKAAQTVFALPEGARWQTSWLLLDRQNEFRETVNFYLEDRVLSLEFDAPYLRERPSRLSVRTAGAEGQTLETTSARITDPYAAELIHFHACIAEGADCKTPPRQARIDHQALLAAFLAQEEMTDLSRQGYSNVR